MSSKSIVVIGSNSFSGSNFIDAALSSGHKVYGVSRSSEIHKVFNGYSRNKNLNNFKFYKLDINDNIEEIVEVIASNRAQYVINFAAQSMVAQSWDNPHHWYETNLVSFSRLIKGIQENAKIEKFVQFSTPEVYGSTDNWIVENFNFSPTTPYAISRAASDFHLDAIRNHSGFPVIFTRAANVFGPRQQIYRIIPKAIIAGLNGRKIHLHGGGESLRSFIHIADVSDALLKIIENGLVGSTYHISTNLLISIRELVGRIASFLSVDFESLVVDSPERAGKDFAYKLSSEKIRAELAWKEQIDIDSGIQMTIDWAKQNLDLLNSFPSEYEHKR